MPIGETIRRLLSGSILASWIAFAIAVAAHGAGPQGSGHGLLRELQAMLMDPSMGALSAQVSGAVVMLVASATLAAMLWAMMFVVCTGRDDFRERMLALTIAFSWMLAIPAVATTVALVTGPGGALTDLFALHWATLLSMLVAGGVEFAWEGRPLASAPEDRNQLMARKLTSHMAVASARLAARTRDNRNEDHK